MGEAVEVNRAGLLEGLPHGFLGRRGGVSTGEVEGLNVGLGSGDEPEAVAENRRRAAAAVLPGASLLSVYQVHSPDCVILGADGWSDEQRPHADALVTRQAGVLIGVVTADCAPVLLADREAGVIGAAHAGWKGAIGGVTDSTIAQMISLGAQRSRIVAAVGPCISQASYEVDDAFRNGFLGKGVDNSRFFSAGRDGHWQFDLELYVASRLESAGIGGVERLGLDTYSAPRRFYSYRRATHRGEAAYGRQISVIGLG
ncbi:peptidoglycan editing factor PgeF [Novosphingobium aerophilum]|uniref:peptidoglycan editing factor PgeF n=1 Tax=Novosphingobium TaxID=165696 RepID=UPI002D76E45F|nr:peptidoglycan editing factor PgeF [Novosphingobium sp. RL4]WRT94729.1 peptidoglycan editing factor PgeF [Novosphingobium sp. RL4]